MRSHPEWAKGSVWEVIVVGILMSMLAGGVFSLLLGYRVGALFLVWCTGVVGLGLFIASLAAIGHAAS